MAVDGWGEVIQLQADSEGALLAEGDAGRLASLRDRRPALRHRCL